MFSDSPVRVIGLATSERFDATEAGELNAAIESAKAYAKLSYDFGASGIRIFPKDFHQEVPQEKTIEQIAKTLDVVGKFAATSVNRCVSRTTAAPGVLSPLRRFSSR